MDTLELARRCAARMDEIDSTSGDLGISVTLHEPGRAETRVEIRSDMVDTSGVCHRGYLFILADSAFAFASNSYNEVTYSVAATVQFLHPVKRGDRLRAVASERSRSGRRGVYDVIVTNQDGTTVAMFRGSSHSTRQPLL